MPPAKKVKFRTLHKFGKRRKKTKNVRTSRSKPTKAADESASSASIESALMPTASSEPVPSTSTGGETIVASSRKIDYFKQKKRVRDSSEDESDSSIELKKKKAEEGVAASDTDDQNPDMNYIIFHGCLQSLIEKGGLLCPGCKKSNLKVLEGGKEKRMGSACLLELRCHDCGQLSTEWTSQKSGIIHTGFDVNRAIVTASSSCGLGYAQTKKYFAMIGMPQPMNQWTWYFYKDRLHAGVKRAADKHLQEAAEQVRSAYADMNIGVPDADGILNISISIDGSWQKRGRTSHNGIVTVIDIITGLVVDFVALSNYCQVCETGPAPDDPSFLQWMEGHRSRCQKTVDCSSAAMEMEGAAIIFSRSVHLHRFRYTEMLGDGDAKTYNKLLEIDPYGGYPIEKIECVNHVTKRMGTALRTLVEKRKAQKNPIGGRGKLTEVRIKKLTNYYGKAIKDNTGDLESMQAAVWASFFHTVSTDDAHNHDFCPAGPSSWCFYQRALAENAAPRPHSQPLPSDIAEALKPVYQRLGDPQLLRRCLAGKTQNSNESFHSLMWRACPKERWANHRTVETALAMAVQTFNKGSSALLDMMIQLELVVSSHVEDYAEKEDTSRVKSATRKTSQKEKERRKRIDDVRRHERQERQEREGDVYAPGQF